MKVKKKRQYSAEEVSDIGKTLKQHDSDVGSAPVQIAMLTARIVHLTGHMGGHRNDKHSRRGLIGMVSKRRKLIKYLKRISPDAYSKTLLSLGLRK